MEQRKMTLYGWIEKNNKQVCTEIIEKYFLFGNGNFNYIYHKSFVKLYVKRLVWVLLSVLTIRRSSYRKFFRIITKQSFALTASYDRNIRNNMLREFFWILLGHGHLAAQDLLPLLPDSEILKKDIHLKSSESPEVSIIIPVYNQLAYTYNCLLSLREKISTHIQYEIIVIDDCSTDSTHTFFMSNATGIVYIRNMDNIGFLRSCNKAASQAKGRFLCFLNNDTQARDGWLENLLKTFYTDQAVGCAGSKLIFPNGLLQEAGGIIYRNGSTDRYGSLEPADLLRFNKAKEVDYCSGASLMIRSSDFRKLRGLDKQFTPAYYEDTDLCMAVKYQLGKKVVYQPLSEIIHFEKVSSEKNTVSSLLSENKSKFIRKWYRELSGHKNNRKRSVAQNYPGL